MDVLILKGAALGYYVCVGIKVAVVAYAACKAAMVVRNIIGNKSLNKKIKNKTFDAAQVDENGRTQLMTAWTATQTEMMIKEGVNVNAKDKNGKTALMYAAERGDAKSVQLLLNAGANIDDVDKHGNSALMYTSIYGNQKTLEALVNAGANTNLANEKGNTALMNLAEREYFWQGAKFNRMSYLIRNGADWTIKDEAGHTALDRYLTYEKSKTAYEIDEKIVKLLSQNPQDVKRENVKKTMSLQEKKSKKHLEDIEKTEQVRAEELQQNRENAARPLKQEERGR